MTNEPVPERDDVSMSAFERAYAADVGESVETLTKRGIFRWHGRCYVSDSINTRYRGWMISQAANAAEIARLQAQVDALAVALQDLEKIKAAMGRDYISMMQEVHGLRCRR